jgi:hypothetical protein
MPNEDKSAAHWVYSNAMAEARIRFELAFEKLEAMTTTTRLPSTGWSPSSSLN